MLITDTSHAIPVQVNRNGLRSIALGSGTINRLELPYIPNSADIQPGDLLITSGLGGRFPPGYPVATVSAVQHDPGNAFASVVATPLAHLNRSREVLLIWPGETRVVKSVASIPPETTTDEQDTPVNTETGEAADGNDTASGTEAEAETQ
jgi:rod shape-determining protein MreC